MSEETKIEKFRTEINSENCCCANSPEPKKSDVPGEKGILKKNDETKECPPISFEKGCPRFEPCPGIPEVRCLEVELKLNSYIGQ